MIQGLLEKRVNWNIGNFIDTGVQTRGDWALYSKTAPTELKTLLSNEWLLKSLEDSASWQKDRSRIFFFVLHISQSNTIIVHYQHCSTCRVGKKITMQNKIKIKKISQKRKGKKAKIWQKKSLDKENTNQNKDETNKCKKMTRKMIERKVQWKKMQMLPFHHSICFKTSIMLNETTRYFYFPHVGMLEQEKKTNSRVAQCWKYSGPHVPVTNGKFK